MFASRFLIQGNNRKVQSLSYCELRGTTLDLAHAVISLRGHSPPRNTGVHALPPHPAIKNLRVLVRDLCAVKTVYLK